MNVGLAAATFALVIPAELPDKTFISSVVLSTRHRPLPVWIGAGSGLVLQAAIAVLAGRLLALAATSRRRDRRRRALPRRRRLPPPREGGSRRGGGRRARRRREDRLVAEEGAPDGTVVGGAVVGGAVVAGAVVGGAAETSVERQRALRIVAVSFGVVALAEFGDLTQVLIANLSARSKDPFSVFVGAALAFIVVSGAGVVAGRTLTRVVPLALVRRLSGLALLGLGILSLVDVL